MKNQRYTVKVQTLRVIAWCVQRDDESGGVFMEPVTLPLDPAYTNGAYVQITEDEHFKQKVKPWNFISVIPATATSQVFLVLEENGKEVWQQYGSEIKQVDVAIGFITQGTDVEEWIEEQRNRAEEEANGDEPEMGFFGFFFQHRTIQEIVHNEQKGGWKLEEIEEGEFDTEGKK